MLLLRFVTFVTFVFYAHPFFFYFQPVNTPANQEDEEFKEKENDEKMEKEMTKDC